MLSLLPYRKYAESLIVGKMPKQDIFDDMRRLQLTIPPFQFEPVYEYLKQVLPGYFASNDKPSSKTLEDLEIAGMVGHLFPVAVEYPQPGIEGSFKLLNDPILRRLVTSLALANMSAEDIELIINTKYSISYSNNEVEHFLHYFFNLSSFSYQEKRQYVDMIGDPSLKGFYKIALTGDKDYLLWKLGVAVEKSYDAMLKDMMMDCFYNFKEKQKYDPDVAQRWGQLAVKVSDKIDKIEKESNDQLEELSKIDFSVKEVDPSQEARPEEQIIDLDDLN